MNTMLCQLKSLLLLGVLLFANGAFGQPMLWDDASSETIVFELTNKEALKLLKGKLRQKQWKNTADSFCPFHGNLEQPSGQRAFSAG